MCRHMVSLNIVWDARLCPHAKTEDRVLWNGCPGQGKGVWPKIWACRLCWRPAFVFPGPMWHPSSCSAMQHSQVSTAMQVFQRHLQIWQLEGIYYAYRVPGYFLSIKFMSQIAGNSVRPLHAQRAEIMCSGSSRRASPLWPKKKYRTTRPVADTRVL